MRSWGWGGGERWGGVGQKEDPGGWGGRTLPMAQERRERDVSTRLDDRPRATAAAPASPHAGEGGGGGGEAGA